MIGAVDSVQSERTHGVTKCPSFVWQMQLRSRPHVLVAILHCVSRVVRGVLLLCRAQGPANGVRMCCGCAAAVAWIPGFRKFNLWPVPLSATFGARVCSWRLGLSRLFFWQFRFFVKFYDRCAFGEVELSRFSSVFSCTGQRNHSWKRSPLNTTTEVN